MTIRAAGLADAGVIAQLHTRSWQSAYRGILSDDFLQGPLPENRRVLWHGRLAEPDRTDQIVLVDEQEGAIRGFACAYLEADPEWGCLLDNLHVVPDLKGQGVGTAAHDGRGGAGMAVQSFRALASIRLRAKFRRRAGSMSGWAGSSPCATPSSRPTERK